MKETYTTPQLEVIALGTEQSILEVSSGILTIMATTATHVDGIETMSGWDDIPETW